MNQNCTWRGWLGAIALIALPAMGDTVKITQAKDGIYNPNHSDVIEVKPGDVVALGADVFSEGADLGQGRMVEEFVWQADDSQNDSCSADSEQNCLDTSNFEITDYGVNFYVPYTMTEQIRISVWNSQDPGQVDTIVLKNVNYQPAYVPPTEVITSPDQYNYPELDTDLALAGHGRWVYISGTRYWVPYSYSQGWEPYQNGYWTWADPEGWTWVSYDPWGWYTDHYGVWRHHGNYGWVWIPFDDRVYRPNTVTWFYADDHVGWYPYYDGWKNGYRHGHAEGFNDGYWDGYNAGRYYANDGRYHPGFTLIEYRNFSHTNILSVSIRNRGTVFNIYSRTYSSNRYGPCPGGVDLMVSRNFISLRVGKIFETRSYDRPVGRGFIRNPRPIYQVPDVYRHSAGDRDRFRRNSPVGSVIERGGPSRGDRVIPRDRGTGRGIPTPPRYQDPRTGDRHEMPPRTRRPETPPPQRRDDDNRHRGGGGDRGGQQGPRNDQKPETPRRPEKPSRPERPQQPEQPRRPETPRKPEAPQQPTRPERPQQPPRQERQQPPRPERPQQPPRQERQQPPRPERPQQPPRQERQVRPTPTPPQRGTPDRGGRQPPNQGADRGGKGRR